MKDPTSDSRSTTSSSASQLAASMLALAAPAIGACQSAPRPLPPVAKQVPFTVRSPHGDREDEYYWLRDDDAEKKRDDVMEYLRAEQAYTDAMMAPVKPLEDRILGEIRARIKEDDSTPPQHDHGYWYWTMFRPGAEYACWMRRKGGVGGFDGGATEELMLDGNELAKGHDFLRVSDVEVSPDGTLVAWTQDTVGRRGHDLRVKDLRSGAIVDDVVKGTLETVVWANDGRSLFYIRQDPVLLQSGPVCRHVLGTPASDDTIVYQEADETLFTSIAATASRKWLAIEMEGYDTTELRAVSLDAPASAPIVVLPRTPDVRCYSNHFNGEWIIRTNDHARDFRIVRAPEAATADRTRWTEIVAHRPGVSVDGFAPFAGGLAVAERNEANAVVRIVPWKGGDGVAIPVRESAFAMTLGDNPDPANAAVRVDYTTMVTPHTTIDVDIATGAQQIVKVRPVIGYDASLYETARAWAPSRDGKRIPISIAWRKDAWHKDAWHKDGSRPIRIEAYGSYGMPSDAEFDLAAVSLMDRGFALAIAHVRGGADMGQDWYEDGRLMHKRNTFNDFLDATAYLAKDGWCDPNRVFATGGSAGGLLMGAIANMGGDRYRGIALHVPFVDALTTMLDESIPLTTNEWTQWGNPVESKEAYEYIRSYAPYDNLEKKAYPAMLVTTGLWDSQVMYFEPAKYVARLRRLKTDSNPLVMHVNMAAGHGGKSGRFERLRQVAMEQAFFVSLAEK